MTLIIELIIYTFVIIIPQLRYDTNYILYNCHNTISRMVSIGNLVMFMAKGRLGFDMPTTR